MEYRLRELNINDKDKVMEMCNEFREFSNENTFEGIDNFGRFNSFEDFLEELEINKHIEDIKPHYVSQSSYVLVDNEDNIYGAINIRYRLCDSLLKRGGNIGYAIRPSKRRMGYGTMILKLGLEECNKLGVNKESDCKGKVLVTCRKDNIGSSSTIKKCGGVKEKEVYIEETGNVEEFYWINL